MGGGELLLSLSLSLGGCTAVALGPKVYFVKHWVRTENPCSV